MKTVRTFDEIKTVWWQVFVFRCERQTTGLTPWIHYKFKIKKKQPSFIKCHHKHSSKKDAMTDNYLSTSQACLISTTVGFWLNPMRSLSSLSVWIPLHLTERCVCVCARERCHFGAAGSVRVPQLSLFGFLHEVTWSVLDGTGASCCLMCVCSPSGATMWGGKGRIPEGAAGISAHSRQLTSEHVWVVVKHSLSTHIIDEYLLYVV